MGSSDGTLQRMVLTMAKGKRRMGRPRKAERDKLCARRMIRLNRVLDAIVEVHRQQLQKDRGIPVESSEAVRDLMEAGARVKGLMPPAES